MRLIICLILLLCGCSTPAVRCDAHLQPINPRAAVASPNTAPKAAAARRMP
jgi:hypothetical protein